MASQRQQQLPYNGGGYSGLVMINEQSSGTPKQKQTNEASYKVRERALAERTFGKIFDKRDTQQFTEYGLSLVRQLSIDPQRLMPKTLEDFKTQHKLEEVAKLYFNHYKEKRIKFLIRINELIVSQQLQPTPDRVQEQSPIGVHESTAKRSRNTLSRGDMVQEPKIILGNKQSNLQLVQSSGNSRNGMRNFKTTQQSTQQRTNTTMGFYKRAAQDSSLTRFVKAREQAEEKQRERIDKLKSQLQSWAKKENKIKEFELETIEERKRKSQIRREKLNVVKSRADLISRNNEERCFRDYKALLNELQLAGGSYSNLSSARKRKHQMSQAAISSNLSEEGSDFNESPAKDRLILEEQQISLRLASFERKMQQGIKRSFEFKRGMIDNRRSLNLNITVDNPNSLGNSVRMEITRQANTSHIEQSLRKQHTVHSKILLISFYVEKRIKHDKNKTDSNEVHKYSVEVKRQKFSQKHNQVASLYKSFATSLEIRRSTMAAIDRKRNESLLEARSANALASTLRKEQQKIRMLDYKENYVSEQFVKKSKKERIMGKHDKIKQCLQQMRQQREKQIHEAYLRDSEIIYFCFAEKRKYLQEKVSSPYDDLYAFKAAIQKGRFGKNGSQTSKAGQEVQEFGTSKTPST